MEDLQGSKRVLWLTRRLLIRLVGAMVKAIEKDDAGVFESDAFHHLTQHSAESSQKDEQPVVVEDVVDQWLINRVDLTVSKDTLELIMFRDEERLSLPLPRHHAKQWLGIMSRLFKIADWPYSGWPIWLEVDSSTEKRWVH